MEHLLEIHQTTKYLYTLRERLDYIEPRFLTKYTNLYLVRGEHSAILFDTGSGMYDVSSTIEPIIEDRELFVINSHNHFDHVGGNSQFAETYIQRMDFKKLMEPMPVDFLEDANPDVLDHFKAISFKLTFAQQTIPLIGDDVFDLGDLEVRVIYTPGHTPGSICLLSSNGELFTGDTLHYGAIYLPDSSQLKYYEESLSDLGKLLEMNPELKIYPGHEDYGVGSTIIEHFNEEYYDLDWNIAVKDEFLQAEILSKRHFTFIRPNDQI